MLMVNLTKLTNKIKISIKNHAF